jgi:hypothetical protein
MDAALHDTMALPTRTRPEEYLTKDEEEAEEDSLAPS